MGKPEIREMLRQKIRYQHRRCTKRDLAAQLGTARVQESLDGIGVLFHCLRQLEHTLANRSEFAGSGETLDQTSLDFVLECT